MSQSILYGLVYRACAFTRAEWKWKWKWLRTDESLWFLCVRFNASSSSLNRKGARVLYAVHERKRRANDDTGRSGASVFGVTFLMSFLLTQPLDNLNETLARRGGNAIDTLVKCVESLESIRERLERR